MSRRQQFLDKDSPDNDACDSRGNERGVKGNVFHYVWVLAKKNNTHSLKIHVWCSGVRNFVSIWYNRLPSSLGKVCPGNSQELQKVVVSEAVVGTANRKVILWLTTYLKYFYKILNLSLI